MSDADYCFIINPAAGGGLAGRNWPALQESLECAGISYGYHLGQHKGDIGPLARAAFDAGHSKFVVVGGDGTANEVLNGVFPHAFANAVDITLGIIPWGTGNDWANYYHLPSTPEDFVALLKYDHSTPQDIGKVSFTNASGETVCHYFLNCLGTGFDSYLLEKMENTYGSRLRYFFYVLKCAYTYSARRLLLNMDKESVDCAALLLEICIGKSAGAGMRFAPAAIADDGLLDVLLIKELNLAQLLSSLPYLYNGRINEHWAARHWQTATIGIGEAHGQNFHCDGELVGTLPAKIELLPRALRVFTPCTRKLETIDPDTRP